MTHISTASGPLIQRFADVLDHINRYQFHRVTRLAKDSGVSPSTVSRIISNQFNPSFALIEKLTNAIEKELGYPIDPRDLIAHNGRFRTRSVCDLTGCEGCLPSIALDEFGSTKPAYQGIAPGTWVTSLYPRGFRNEEGIK